VFAYWAAEGVSRPTGKQFRAFSGRLGLMQRKGWLRRTSGRYFALEKPPPLPSGATAGWYWYDGIGTTYGPDGHGGLVPVATETTDNTHVYAGAGTPVYGLLR
jgi:hypothetical protein